MKRTLKGLSALILSANLFGECPITESRLIGSWKAASAAAPFEVMSFEKETGKLIFNSWRHGRPDYMEAGWKIEQCSIRILHANEKALNVDLAIIEASIDKIVVREPRHAKAYTFLRIQN